MNKTILNASHSDQVFALRPAADASLQECKAARRKIGEKAAELAARMAEIKNRRTEYLLESTGEDLFAMDREIALIKIAIEQIEAIVPALDARIEMQGQSESAELLKNMRAELVLRRQAFLPTFFERYSAIQKAFFEIEEELRAVNDETDTFNASVAAVTKRFGSAKVERLRRRIVHSDYLNRVSLPKLSEFENLGEPPGIGYLGDGLTAKFGGSNGAPTESLYDLVDLEAG